MASREPGSSVGLIPWVATVLLAVGVERALALPEICTQCPGGVQNTSRVAVYCENTSESMQARCCLNQKGTILGLDLQNCSLKDPGPNFFHASTAVIIDLQTNPLKEDLTNTFRGFTQLQTLILPLDVTCPGGINAWESITSFTDKQICQGQKDLCNSTGSPGMLWNDHLNGESFSVFLSVLSACTPAHQKRAPDLITDGCEPPCGCWELNSGPLEEKPVLLTAESFLQPKVLIIIVSVTV
ncbi:all-trans retinoic acid-induced differentiation factor isoform X1 [Microtus pennsylvanicus]|uniref:all-trans retinoic acid-induced differentiation factor isoform X1 n=1 Tax=Microtus pennsylvanicus TaxID=10058 RepID=UPI003F6A8689